MALFVFIPKMREAILQAKAKGGTLTPEQIQAMKSYGTLPVGGGMICDPRAYSPGCATTQPVKIESVIPLDNGMTKVTAESETEVVTAVVDKTGDVKAVEVKPSNKLIPLALLAAGAILLGG